MSRLNWSIRDRIMAPYLALIVAMVGVTGLACGGWAASRAWEQGLERGRGIAETLTRSHFPLTLSVLDQLKGLGGAEFALVDAAGNVVSSTLGPIREGEAPAEPVWDKARQEPRPPGTSDLSFDRAWTHGGTSYRVGIVEWPARPERLLILLPEPALRSAAWEARRAALLLSLVGAILAALLATWVGRTLSTPLSAILRAIRQIGRGDLHPSGLPVRDDEIGELAEGVRQMAEWLRALQEERVQTERLRLIRQVSAGLAHELRNPLTAARMTLQLFNERNRDRDTEPLRIALNELNRMERQVRRFLQLARPEPPVLEIAAPGPILEGTCAGLAATAEHQGVSLEVDTNAALPCVRVDLEQIGQALTNLVANALDAAGPGGHVRVHAEAIGRDHVALSVEDDGPGIAEGIEARLFEPFVTTKPEGVGLGLALSLALVREQGGSIEYDRDGGWTRFRILLPAGESGGVASAEQNPAPYPPPQGGRDFILVSNE
jgi:signal transduction histidine kinase